METLHELNRLLERINGIFELTYKEKMDECDEAIKYLNYLFVLTDIAQDIMLEGQSGIPYYVCSLSLRTYLEFLVNLFQGAYHSAARALRWLYEANLAGAAACIKPSLLSGEFIEVEMDLDKFELWLALLDERRTEFPRKRIFEGLGLPAEKLQELFSDLCKYVHISRKSLDEKLTWPNLQYIPEKSDEILTLARKTVDLILWLECKMLLQYNDRTKEALKKLSKDIGALASKVPGTAELIYSL
ncbi:MAG: hypothetical protein QXQ94_10150 [Candidatus Bathyarchaeia archaeon]